MKTCFFQVSSSIDINLNKEQTYNVLSFNYSLNAEKRMFIQPLNVLISLVNTCTNALIRLKLKTIFGIQAKEFCNWTDTSSNIILYSLIFKGQLIFDLCVEAIAIILDVNVDFYLKIEIFCGNIASIFFIQKVKNIMNEKKVKYKVSSLGIG